MGMFSQNRTMLGDDFEVIANESYQGAAGAYRAMTEGFQNSYAVFESCIGLDFMEAAVVNESADASEFEVVQEGFAGDFFSKIKEFLVKLIEKIKGIVKSFIAKVTGTFCKDGKALVNKYKGDVLKKDLSKMKYKWMKEKSVPVLSHKNLSDIYTSCMKNTSDLKARFDSFDKHGNDGQVKTMDDANSKYKDELNDNSAMEKDLGTIIGNGTCELSEFAKEFHDKMFDDEEECEGFGSDGASLTEIMSDLIDGKKSISKLEKEQKNQEKETKQLIKDVENARKAFNNLVPDKGASDKKKGYMSAVNARLNLAMTAANQISTVQTKYFACLIDESKKYLARCKKVFVQAAAYRPKSTNEDAILVDALGEAAEYEVCELFDAIA